MSFKVLDLFSGIGAYSLGLERAGMKTVAFCEINPYCRKVLKRHWPNIPCYEDVKEVTGARLRADGITADVIVAGWPCQGISVAGTRRGLDDPRSGLWGEIARIASDIRPRVILLENSTNLLAINGGRDFGTVLGDLASLRYNVEWHCLPAAAFDALHIRDRLWIVGLDADANGERLSGSRFHLQSVCTAADQDREANKPNDDCQTAADCHDQRQLQPQRRQPDQRRRVGHGSQIGAAIARRQRHQWKFEPRLARVVSRVANRVDRIRALGNCNPPIIAETIGRAIIECFDFA